jgi:hypothetical protein
MSTYSTTTFTSLHKWLQRVEPVLWCVSLVCFSMLGMIVIRLPEPVLIGLVIGISTGPLATLARRSLSTALLVVLIILSECALDLMNIVLSNTLHAAVLQALFGLVLGSLGHAFAVASNRGRRAIVMPGMLWILSAAALIAAVMLFSAASIMILGGLPADLLARLPTINLLIALGGFLSMWLFLPVAFDQDRQSV